MPWEISRQQPDTNPTPRAMNGTSAIARNWRLACVLALIAVLRIVPLTAAEAGAVPDDAAWDERFACLGVDDQVNALVADGRGHLYAAGSFVTAGGVVANRIASWDGTRWTPLGSGMDDFVYALAVDNDGRLYAGGRFTTAGGIVANHVARWDGTNWAPLGAGTSGDVSALATDSQGHVYAGGSFLMAGGGGANAIARWDGTNWSALGTGTDHRVTALAVDDSDNLYVAGWFATAGGVAANRIAKWNGTNWSALGAGIGTRYDTPEALALDDSGNLYVGGNFSTAGGATARNLARWNGTNWTPLGSGTNGTVYALTVDGSGRLHAGGHFTTAGGGAANSVARWDGASWFPLGSGVDTDAYGAVRALAVDGSGALCVGGDFTTAGAVVLNHIAIWNGAAWGPLGSGSGLNDDVYAVALDRNGSLYAGGRFTFAGDVLANSVARWDGMAWTPLGSGMSNAENYDMPVEALAVDDNGDVYAGGRFTSAGGVVVNSIARWNGSAWAPLGSGLSLEPDTLGTGATVYALALDGRGGLYAAGHFTAAGEVAANRIARWDGAQWAPLGSGVGTGAFENVSALAVDGSGNLYAAGNFTTAGGVAASNIARWDGATWAPLGTGTNGTVFDLAVDDNGTLYAGGYFTTAGDVAAANIARWDGMTWTPLGSGVGTGGHNGISALALDREGRLFAGGWFTSAGGVVANRIARWDGASWDPLGSGLSLDTYDAVYGLAVDSRGDVYVGGLFTTAGGKPASRLALWHGSAVVPTYLLHFAAERQGAAVTVRCELAEPAAAAGLELWRSVAGRSRALLGVLSTAGATSLVYTDVSPPLGEADYWLRAVGAAADAWLGSVHLAAATLPRTLTMAQNHPNPFNPRTTISYGLPKAGHARLAIYDVRGSLVVTLVDAEQPAGEHTATWTGTDTRGVPVPSGPYFARLWADAGIKSIALMLVR